MNNTFSWADLSTFDIHLAKRFYKQCFGWEYQEIDSGYLSCQAEGGSAAGLYTMPEKFQKNGMPSFWMPYIQVEDIEELAREAERQGAKVEIKPQPAPGGGMIALIRDPAGAGFTVFEGDDLRGSGAGGDLGCVVWNELHVSDLAKVRSFYANVFGWRIEPTDVDDRYQIFAPTDSTDPIAGIQVTPNDIKGDKEYWGIYFSVNNLSKSAKSIESNGGRIVAEQPLGNRPALLAYDSQDAAFYITGGKNDSDAGGGTITKQTQKWRAMLGLVIVAVAVVTEANWIWGLLFLLWVVPDIQSGSTHFLEYVERNRNPVVYWLIMITWLALSAYLLVEGLIAPSKFSGNIN